MKSKMIITIVLGIIIVCGAGIIGYKFASMESSNTLLGNKVVSSSAKTNNNGNIQTTEGENSNTFNEPVQKVSQGNIQRSENTEKIDTERAAKPVIQYASDSQVNQVVGNYVTARKNEFNPNELSFIKSINIGENGVIINGVNGNVLYNYNGKIETLTVSEERFKELFGQDISQIENFKNNEIQILKIGNVYVETKMDLSPTEGYIYVSFNGQSGMFINENVIIKPINASKWYGEYKIGKPIKGTGSNPYKEQVQDLEGDTFYIGSNSFSFPGAKRENPNYYFVKVNPNSYFGQSAKVVKQIDGETYFLAVLNREEPLTNGYYKSLPNYIGCMSGAWDAGVAMPIILGANGNVQVMNDIGQIYNVERV